MHYDQKYDAMGTKKKQYENRQAFLLLQPGNCRSTIKIAPRFGCIAILKAVTIDLGSFLVFSKIVHGPEDC